MMNQQEIFKEIVLLPLSEQLEVIEKVRHNIGLSAKKNDITDNEFDRELTVDERIAIAKNLSGCLKPDGGYIPMTKEEEREFIEEYLAEKMYAS